MSSSATKQPFPPDIEEKVRLLKSHQERMQQLNSQLAATKQECDRLEREIEVYQASVAPIRNCPPEILSMFFEHYVTPNPRFVGDLLFVCKLWYNIIVNTPRFWTTLGITFDSTNHRKTVNLIAHNALYITACLKHSASSLIHIDVDFGALQVYSSHWPEIVRTFGLLTGTLGSSMWRWKAAKLSFSAEDEDLIVDIWDLLIGTTPNLTDLTLTLVMDGFSNHRLHRSGAFPDLSALKKLTVEDAYDQEVLELAPSSLEYLEIYLNLGAEEWPALNSLTSLQTLILHNSWLPLAGVSPGLISTLHLPTLQNIVFIGDFINLTSMDFDCPSLQHLTFIPEISYAPYELPSLKPKAISWGLYKSTVTKWKDPDVARMLRDILISYQTVETLEIGCSAERVVRSVIKELTLITSLPSSLRTLLVIGEDGDVTSTCIPLE